MLTLIAAVAISANAYTYRIPNDGQYPDATETPGAVNADLTRDVICSRDFRTSAYRHVTQAQYGYADAMLKQKASSKTSR